MPAFISHSSKDKDFVDKVVNELGSLEIEYDQQTFDFTLNVQAIRNAMRRSTIVVFFVSQNSMSSTFVQEEQRQALEALGRGDIKRVMIFMIDNVSFRALPEWMREINIVQNVSNPKACVRRIKSALVQVDASSPVETFYLGRNDEEAALRKAVAVPKSSSPIVIHASGFHGVGRRTFVENSLRRILPRYYDFFSEIPTAKYQGIEDIYRALYQLQVVSSVSDTIADFEKFTNLSIGDQATEVAKLIFEMAADGTFIFVPDELDVLDEEGNYQEYWLEILKKLEAIDRPCLAFIQSRTQPFRFQVRHPRSYHVKIKELTDADSRELVALSLREQGIDFNESQLNQLVSLVDGHPYNLRFVVGYAKHYELQNFLQDPREFIE